MAECILYTVIFHTFLIMERYKHVFKEQVTQLSLNP
jgi:hypothetical protein